MSKTKSDFDEQLNLLFRAIRQPGLFRFILIQYNNYTALTRVVSALRDKYPERPFQRIRIAEEDYASLIQKITDSEGLIVIEDFNRLLADPDIYVGFNQRRDKITGLPVQLLCFLPAGPEYMRACMEKIRDWWSVRNLVLEFEAEHEPAMLREPGLERYEVSSLGGYDAAGKREELERILARIDELESGEKYEDLLRALYPQALEILDELGEYRKGLEVANRWREKAEKAEWYGEDKMEIFNRLGIFNWRLGRFIEATGFFEEAISHANKSKRQIDVAKLKSNLGNVYSDLGRYEEAARLLEEALESDLNNFGSDHPYITVSQSNLGDVYRHLGRYEEAARLLEEAFKSGLKNFGFAHPNVTIYQSNLANVYKDLGRYDEAAKLLEDALHTALKNFGPAHPSVAVRQSNLATAYGYLGRYSEAARLLEKSIESAAKNFGPTRPDIALRQINLGSILVETGEKEKAKDLFKQAYDLLKKQLGEAHPHTRTARAWLESVV